jgi:putative ABC transport system permease protein
MKSLVVPLQEQMVGSARRGLLTLAAAVASVLLLLGVNLAGLLLARASDREREAALRTALGASRGRVLRQLVIENLLLAVAGGGLGVALAGGLLSVLATRLPVDLPRFDEVHLSAIGIGIALLLTLLTGVLFSLLPALRLSAAPPREALAAGGRALGAGKGTARLRGALVSGQVALSTVLLIVAGLLVASFVRLISVPRGFDTEHVVLATVVPAPDRHADDAERVAFFDRLLEAVRALPGLETTALVSYAPLKGEAHVHTLTREHDTRLVTLRPAGNIRYVSPDYFQALGIRLTRGRALTDADRGRLVIVINERTAHVLWPGQDPIGKRLHQGDEAKPLLEVVGTVADTREVALQREPLLMGYVPYFGRRVPQSATLVLRTPLDPATLAEPIRQAVWRVDPTLPAPDIRSLRQVAADAVAPERFQMVLIGAFAAGALLLAALGIYGVPAYTVARRTPELGLRLALGARPGDLLSMVIAQGLRPVGVGLLLGLAGSLAIGRFVAGLLFDVTPHDPATLAGVLLLVGAVALVACYVPARRATRIDPMTALRAE